MAIMLRLGKYITYLHMYSIQVEGSEDAMYSGTAFIDTQVTITMTLMVVVIILTIILMVTVTMTKMMIMLMMTRRRRPVDTKL